MLLLLLLLFFLSSFWHRGDGVGGGCGDNKFKICRGEFGHSDSGSFFEKGEMHIKDLDGVFSCLDLERRKKDAVNKNKTTTTRIIITITTFFFRQIRKFCKRILNPSLTIDIISKGICNETFQSGRVFFFFFFFFFL